MYCFLSDFAILSSLEHLKANKPIKSAAALNTNECQSQNGLERNRQDEMKKRESPDEWGKRIKIDRIYITVSNRNEFFLHFRSLHFPFAGCATPPFAHTVNRSTFFSTHFILSKQTTKHEPRQHNDTIFYIPVLSVCWKKIQSG